VKRWLSPSLLLFVGVALIYLANGRPIGSGDSLPARYLPFSILGQGTFTLDAFPVLYGGAAKEIYPLLDGVPYYLRYRDGHYLSAYSPAPAVLALPVYVLPVLAGLPPTSAWVGHLEKLAAALVTALSVVLLFRALGLVVSRRWALGIAAVYALGTSSLSASSQGLWQHGPSQLFLALGLYWLARGLGEERYLGPVGFALASAMVMRATNLLLVLPLAAWILYRHPAVRLRFIGLALLPIAGVGLYTLRYFGLEGAGWGHARVSMLAFFAQVPWLEGLAGLLSSPSRGLFVYSPVLVFSLFGIAAVWRHGPPLLRALSLGPILVFLLIGKWFMWWGGHTFGPRILADTTPVLAFLLYPVTGYLDRRRLARGIFALCAVLSIAAHALGAFFYDGRWDGLARVDRDYSRLWTWRGSPLPFYAREALGAALRPRPGAAGGQPTSADSPALLSAAYALEPLPQSIHAGEALPIVLTATNTGRAVWLASAPGDRGVVRLGWRWYRGDREVLAGREALPSDVWPGGAIRLTSRIMPPGEAGDYALVLDLVSEHVTWFSAQGGQPLAAGLRVLDLDPARLLAAPPGPEAAAPSVSVATDRPAYRRGDVLGLAIELRNPERPRSFDAYLILQGPGGEMWFYDGYGLSGPERRPWAAWATRLPLPARITGRFAVPTAALAPGRYAWHLALTEPGAHGSRARASAAFTLDP
jgi:hypothetical protein